MSQIQDNIKLILVLSGNHSQLEKVKLYYDKCIVLNNLPYNELISFYKGALGLLIPLRPTIEDKARFPNKISEYLASKGLLVTTNFGEIPYYFTNELNSLISTQYSVESFSKQLNKLKSLSHEQIKKLKNSSYKIGLDFFDMKSYHVSLNNFMNKINDNRS